MIGIFVSYSRLTILLALFLLILGLIDQLKIKFKMGFMVLGIIFVSFGLALSFSSGIVGNEISAPFLTNNPDLTKESVEKRVYIWPVAWQVFLQKPLAGYGLENINQAFSGYLQTKQAQFERAAVLPPPPVATPVPGTGDGNGDGKINLVDLSVLLSDFNKETGFRRGIDLNGDGKINTFDFSLMRNLLIQKGVIRG